MEFKGTKGKWYSEYKSGYWKITDDERKGSIADVYFFYDEKDTAEHNAKLIEKAPEMLFELNETLKDLLVLQGNVLESTKIDKKWDGMYELIQTWIDRKKQLIKEATEL